MAVGYAYVPWNAPSFMQKALERKASVAYLGTPWAARPGFPAVGQLDSLVAALPAQPDLFLFVDSGDAYFPRGVTHLDCPTACYLIDVHVRPHQLAAMARFFDYAFTAQRDFVSVLRDAGHPQAHWLPLAFDPEVHGRRERLPKRYDIGFLGTTKVGYERRRALVERLSRRFHMNERERLYEPPEMARLYSECRIVFNCSMRHEVNQRLFEGPASGSLLLTDHIDNGLGSLVTDREHVVMYDDELVVELAERFLRDDETRERIAEQGYTHVHAHHTYAHRIDEILETVFGGSGQPRLEAPLRRASDGDLHVAYAELFSLMGRLDDTIDEYASVPPQWRYRLRAGGHLLRGLARRARYLTTL